MARADESLVVLEFIAEIFDGSAAEFSKVASFPFAPDLVAKKIVQCSLITFGFQVLRQIADDSEAKLNGDQQV